VNWVLGKIFRTCGVRTPSCRSINPTFSGLADSATLLLPADLTEASSVIRNRILGWQSWHSGRRKTATSAWKKSFPSSQNLDIRGHVADGGGSRYLSRSNQSDHALAQPMRRSKRDESVAGSCSSEDKLGTKCAPKSADVHAARLVHLRQKSFTTVCLRSAWLTRDRSDRSCSSNISDRRYQLCPR
jgi:hypothetical protein